MKPVVTQLVCVRLGAAAKHRHGAFGLRALRPDRLGGAMGRVEEGATISVSMIWWRVPFELQTTGAVNSNLTGP